MSFILSRELNMMLKLKARYNDAKNDLDNIGIYGDLHLIFKFLMGLDPFG